MFQLFAAQCQRDGFEAQLKSRDDTIEKLRLQHQHQLQKVFVSGDSIKFKKKIIK